MLALATGGCSYSYKLGGLFGHDKDDKAETTGTLTPAPKAATTPVTAASEPAAAPAEADLAIARVAASEAVARSGEDISVPWENPRTGARGTVTPLAAAYTQDGFVCRDFLASYVRGRQESWLQGEACRIHQGRWEVRNMKPWRRS